MLIERVSTTPLLQIGGDDVKIRLYLNGPVAWQSSPGRLLTEGECEAFMQS
jgi:hypothetical protein